MPVSLTRNFHISYWEPLELYDGVLVRQIVDLSLVVDKVDYGKVREGYLSLCCIC